METLWVLRETWGEAGGRVVLVVVGAGWGASSSCLQSSRKSQQISYRDDGWSGSFHPAQQGSRHGTGIRNTPSQQHLPSPIFTAAPHNLLLSPPPLPSSHRPAIHYRLLAAGRTRRPVWLLNGSAALAPLKRCHINTEQPLRTAAGPRETGPESACGYKSTKNWSTQKRKQGELEIINTTGRASNIWFFPQYLILKRSIPTHQQRLHRGVTLSI